MCRHLILLAVTLVVASAANVCTRGRIVNMPSNGKPFYWPTSWNENSTAPQLQNHQSCSWTVTVPQGYYAKLIIDGKTVNSSGQFQTIDAAGNLITTTHENKEPYYYPPAKFTIAVENSGTTHFAFKIVWAPLPGEASIIRGIGDVGFYYNASNKVYSYAFDSASDAAVSLLPFPDNQHNLFSYRSALVFNGNLQEGTYLSNLYLIAKTKKQWLAPTGSVFIQNVDASPASNDLLLVQDSSDTKDIKQYVELNCGTNSTCTKTVNAGTSKSALVSLRYLSQTMVSCQMEDTATMTVYYGSPAGFPYFQTYNTTTLNSTLPYNFGYGFTTYVISHGQATFTFNL